MYGYVTSFPLYAWTDISVYRDVGTYGVKQWVLSFAPPLFPSTNLRDVSVTVNVLWTITGRVKRQLDI